MYLTVNTLLKDREIETLHDYLEPLYLHGLDAVIVQDVGVLELIRHDFPDLEIHASTQMSSVNVKAAQFLQSQGVTRVVPTREIFRRFIVQQGWRLSALSMGHCVTAIPASACSAA